MTAGTWGDRAVPPGYLPDRVIRDWLNRPPVLIKPHDWYMEEVKAATEAQRAETEARERRNAAREEVAEEIGRKDREIESWRNAAKALALGIMAGCLFLFLRS